MCAHQIESFSIFNTSSDDTNSQIIQLVNAAPAPLLVYADIFDYSRQRLCERLVDHTIPTHPPVFAHLKNYRSTMRSINYFTSLYTLQNACLIIVPELYSIPLRKVYPSIRFVACLDTESIFLLAQNTSTIESWSDIEHTQTVLSVGYIHGQCGCEIWETIMKQLQTKPVKSIKFFTYADLVQAWHKHHIDIMYIYCGDPSPFLSGLTNSFKVKLIDMGPLFSPDNQIGINVQTIYPHWIHSDVNLFRCVDQKDTLLKTLKCYPYTFSTQALIYHTFGFRRLLVSIGTLSDSLVAKIVTALHGSAGTPSLSSITRDKLPTCPYDMKMHEGAAKVYDLLHKQSVDQDKFYDLHSFNPT